MRSVVIVFCAVLILFSFSQVRATIIHVPGDQPSIQAGIDASSNGDTVLVAPDTYYEHINFNGKAILVKSEDGPENTILEKQTDGIPIVAFNSGEDRNSVIDGFTVRRAQYSYGIQALSSSPTVINNIIAENYNPEGDGAGLDLENSGAAVGHNIFRDNTATYGAGVHIYDSGSDSIFSNSFLGNSGPVASAIRVLYGSLSFFGNNLVYGNGDFTILIGGSNQTQLIGNTITGNTTPNGAVVITGSDEVNVVNNIISSNNGFGINVYGGSADVSILYDDVWDNSSGDYVGVVPGEGCISADPMFCDPGNDDYYLYATSPCLGTGQAGVNIGAFGVGCSQLTVTAGPDQAGPINSQVTVFFYVQSDFDSTYTFSLHISDSLGWNVDPTYSEMILASGQIDSISATASIPHSITGTSNRITAMATFHEDTIILSRASLMVTVSPRTIHVPGEHTAIQAGINASGPGDTVLVAPNTYYEHINLNGKPILVKSERGADSTVISMLAGGVSMVSFVSGEDSNSVLDGFTVTGAFLEVGQGAGIKCQNSSPKIVNNRIVDNSCPYGAGIDCDDYSSPIIANNVIEQNPATSSGGGIRCNNHSSPVIRENLIVGNSAVESGAGIWCEDNCSPTIVGNLIAQNTAETGYGGGIGLLNSSVADIINNTIDANSASTGGGIYIGATSSATIQNTIVTNTTSGKGVRHDGASPIFLYYCDVWNNLDQDYYGCLPGDGCISDDPVYCDPNNGNHSLWAGSPCLGTGQEGTDIGAFGEGCSGVGDANGDGEVNIGDVVYLVSYLYKAGPAPQPIPAGDVNCDDLINVGDIVYLINYLFKGGPPPCEP